jgi:hypothetical protein
VVDADASRWLRQGDERLRVFGALSQPLTADQLAMRLSKARTVTSEVLRQLRIYRLVACLNQAARQNRVYGLTEEGVAQLALLQGVPNASVPPTALEDWALYGDLCFRHRRTVLLTLRGRMRPPQVKRIALANNPRLRMSIDNTREVLWWMTARNVVRAVRPHGMRYALYELTDMGRRCQALMRQAMARSVA